MITSTARSYRGVRRIGDTRDLWSAPAKRSGDGALTVPAVRAEGAKAGSRFACPRTPKLPAPQPNVAHPTVPSVSQRHAGSGLPAAPLRSAAQAGDSAYSARVPSRGRIYGARLVSYYL